MKKALVCGAGGFIGSHLVNRLKSEDYWVRGVDLKYPEFDNTTADDFVRGDLRNQLICREIVDQHFDEVYQLAADMGGAGFVFTGENDADIMHNSALINLNILEACYKRNLKRIFYSSSACIYPEYNQMDPDNPKCAEDTAYPAKPDSEYGWEKLFSERLYFSFHRNYDMEVRIARYHNIFGPNGTWRGGREKAPAAICRKVVEASDGGEIEIWGDGKQTRSFLYIDECLEGTLKLIRSDFIGPFNIGSEEMVTINQLVEMVMKISGKRLTVKHIQGPLGVRGRNSDNKLINEKLKWKPSQPLFKGLEKTYIWIEQQVKKINNLGDNMQNKPTFSIVGLGKLGASMAAAIADRGFQVIGVDVNHRSIDSINTGHAPVQETNLEETIIRNKERLYATLSHKEAVMNTDASFVVVPTPSDEKGAFSLQYAAWAFKEIGRSLSEKGDYHLVVLTSTVLPGSMRYGLLPILERESGKKCGKDFGLCYSPEFIALGSIIHDFLNPDFTLIGEFDEKSGSMLESCYKQIMVNNPSCKRMSMENAELAKVALNTYITTKITYANMLAELCERIPGGDVDVVTDAIGTDTRIGNKYLKGAFGYGGPCFPRDNVALSYLAKALGTKADIAETTHSYNKAMVGKIVEKLKNEIHKNDTVAILGLAYKPYSHVIEESQGVCLAQALIQAGIRVVAFDPLAGEMANIELEGSVLIFDSLQDCLDQADVVLITTPDPAFKAIHIDNFKGRKVIVVDFWRFLDKQLSNSSNICYIPFGRSLNESENAECLANIWNIKNL